MSTDLTLSRLDDWKVIDRFEREARVLALLRHPAVPAYVDHFALEGDQGPSFYLVQQIAPGRSLSEAVIRVLALLSRARIPLSRLQNSCSSDDQRLTHETFSIGGSG